MCHCVFGEAGRYELGRAVFRIIVVIRTFLVFWHRLSFRSVAVGVVPFFRLCRPAPSSRRWSARAAFNYYYWRGRPFWPPFEEKAGRRGGGPSAQVLLQYASWPNGLKSPGGSWCLR